MLYLLYVAYIVAFFALVSLKRYYSKSIVTNYTSFRSLS